MREVRAVVVGAGVMGAAAAWRLARAGAPPLVLERFWVGHDRGSSHGRARVFRFSYPEPAYVEMAMEALPLWRELEGEAGREVLRTTGGLDLGPPERVEAHARALEACGAGFEVLEPAEARARFPAVAVPDDGAVLFQGDAGVVRADLAVRALLERAMAAGAEVREETPVLALRPQGEGVEVVAGAETHRAPVAVVTAGAWARGLLAPAGVELPVVPSRETVAFFRTEQPHPVVVEWTEPALYALPSPGQGLKAGWHHSGPDADPDRPEGPSRDVVERLSGWVAERFPRAEPSPHHVETCLYTNTDDERFILERHGPLVVGSACSGHGFKFAPLIGERLARLALDGA